MFRVDPSQPFTGSAPSSLQDSPDGDTAAPVAKCMVVEELPQDPESSHEPRVGEEFTVVLVKSKDKSTLGIKVLQAVRKCLVRISHLTEGLVQDWNDAHPERRVKVGDVILEINGMRGPTSVALTEMLRSESRLALVVQRCG